jgi:hypothetical protein
MNKQTEQLGIDAVIAYERRAGRAATRAHKCGFDLVSKSRTEERHIEVKATEKRHFTDRWLELLEWQCAQSDPLFFLYLVTQVSDGSPRIFEYDRQKLQKRFNAEVRHYTYRFPKSDFV